MKLFLDASAVVSMLAKEDDALELADRLDEADELLWSPIVIWETVAALARIREIGVTAARGDVQAFGTTWGIRLVPIGEFEGQMASEAFRLYGKGSGHNARLNMGDCFSYGCAKSQQASLLYKGKDFSQTDLA